jgi:putative salt-induced outer membrane protein YdiY
MKFFRIPLPCVAILFSALVADGAIVELTNGDRISGRITSREAAALHIESVVLGNIRIPAGSIANIVEQPGDVPVSAPAPAVAEAPAPAPLAAPINFLPDLKPLASTTERFLAMLNIWEEWKSNLSIGLNFVSGETSASKTSLNFSTERKRESDEIRVEMMQEYATSKDSDGVETTSRDYFKTLGRYRYNVSKMMFFQSETQYFFSRTQDIDHDFRQSLGLGWRILQTPRLTLNLTPSLTAQYQVLDGDDNGWSLAPTLSEELVYEWSASTSIRQNASALFPVTGDSEPSYHFSTSLQNKFVDNLTINISYIFDYDESVGDNVEKSEHSFTLGVGVSF